MTTLAKNLNLHPDYILKQLPLAKGQQYLCAIAIQNGQHPVWMDETYSIEQKLELASNAIRNFIERRNQHESDTQV